MLLIKGIDKTWKPFVQNWVNELTSTELWKHCSGKNNPADLPSCGLTHHLSYVSQSILWHKRPDWLHDSNHDVNLEVQPTTEYLVEMRTEDQKTSHGLLALSEIKIIVHLIVYFPSRHLY